MYTTATTVTPHIADPALRARYEHDAAERQAREAARRARALDLGAVACAWCQRLGWPAEMLGGPQGEPMHAACVSEMEREVYGHSFDALPGVAAPDESDALVWDGAVREALNDAENAGWQAGVDHAERRAA
jgi:hypothetical protein